MEGTHCGAVGRVPFMPQATLVGSGGAAREASGGKAPLDRALDCIGGDGGKI